MNSILIPIFLLILNAYFAYNSYSKKLYLLAMISSFGVGVSFYILMGALSKL
jgi:hypothetical protein